VPSACTRTRRFRCPAASASRTACPDLVALDALKIAYTQTLDPTFVQLFVERRDHLLAELFPEL